MKRASAVTAILIVQLFLTSCVSSVTQSTIPFHEEQPTGNDAIVYVYRLKSVVGSAGSFVVRLDNKKVAVLRQNAYIVLHVTPGAHTITVGDWGHLTVGPVTATPSAGAGSSGAFSAAVDGAYYLRCQGPQVGFLAKEEAMKELINMKYDTGGE